MFRASGLAIALLLFSTSSFAGEATLPDGSAKEKVQTACTECHEARILLQQRLSPATWTKEVDKMVKWGALVDAADRDAVIQYLSSNFPPTKAPEPETRTARSK
jgi:virginiamycin B lyase